jgi:hypothetical protein
MQSAYDINYEDLKPEEFVNTINKIWAISDKLGIPVDDMSENINQEQKRKNEVTRFSSSL